MNVAVDETSFYLSTCYYNRISLYDCIIKILTQAYSNSVLSGLDNATIVYTRGAAGARFYEILVIKRKQKPCAQTNPFIRQSTLLYKYTIFIWQRRMYKNM